MMIRAKINVKGRVQKAGYKDTVDEAAYYLDVKGYVKNLDDGTVEVVCEGDKKDIEELVKKTRVREYPIFVESVKVEYSEATGEFKQFDIIRENDITEATYERMDAAARYMRGMNKDLGEKIDSMHHDLKDGQDKMLEKQDTTIDTLKDFRDCTKRSFTDMGNRYGSIQDELVNTRKELAKLVEHIGILVEEHIKKKEK